MFEHKPRPEWIATEEFLSRTVVHPDDAVQQAIHTAADAGMPAIEVAPNAGKLLKLLVQLSGARRILEIGTLAGYSTIWMGRGLPHNGKLVTCEYLPQHAEVAWANIDAAGLGERVEIRLGPALETLAALEEEDREPFDFIFIDADKTGYPDYFEWSLKLSRRGTVIVADNIVRKGAVVDAASNDANVRGVRRFNELLVASKRVAATAIQTVGGKGYDGFVLGIVN
jgi:predicted O-methyltransferase YrrM